ncbi:hypothetical protein HYW76_02315 [Candidatus Pacearchaeota archaeon]|nr:hypothetical protein [Candidatus Pacearchaeota archaeon]
MISLASYSQIFNFADLLNELSAMGFFSLILPFLLIFALVYAIVMTLPIFKENKGAAAIMALAIGLLSLQFGIVSDFFQHLFPNLGIGLSILLAGLILAGVFLSGSGDASSYKWIFFGLAALIFFIVVMVSLSDWSYGGSGFNQWSAYRGIFIVVIVLAAAIFAIIKKA